MCEARAVESTHTANSQAPQTALPGPSQQAPSYGDATPLVCEEGVSLTAAFGWSWLWPLSQEG